MTSPGRMTLPLGDDYSHDDDLSIDDFETGPMSNPVPPLPTDAKTLERLAERSYVRDWQRLGLCNSNSSPTNAKAAPDQFRLTAVNSIYMMCRRSVKVFLLSNNNNVNVSLFLKGKYGFSENLLGIQFDEIIIEKNNKQTHVKCKLMIFIYTSNR